MKKFIFLLLSCISMLLFFTVFLVNAQEGENLNYSECNTFNYVGDVVNESHYNLDERNNEIVGDDVLLTVLTHGLGGNANHWAENSNGKFGYDENSIIASLAKSLDNKVNVKRFIVDDMTLADDEIDFTNKFGCQGGDNYHTILVFETKQPFKSNDYVYKQFDYAVSKAVYDIKQTYGKLPKINLIGHSRGGIINLLYAMDHPLMVNQIFSIGTPYVGSSTAELDIKYNLGIGIGETDKGGDEGERDIIDSTLYNSYMNRWNNNYDRYYKYIDVHAIGSVTTIPYINSLLSDNNTINYINNQTKSDYSFKIKMAQFYFSTKFCTKWYLWGPALLETVIIEDAIINFALPDEVNKLIDTEIKYNNRINTYVWKNDGLVNLPSAIGTGYLGFKNSVKIFNSYDTNAPCVDKSMPAVPHNLLTKDSAFINEVVTNIEMNGKTSSKYLYTVMQNGYIRIDSYIGHETDVVVPYRIDDKKVLEINRNAFNGLLLCDENGEIINNTNAINSITISSFVNTVNKTAFANCSSLEKISFVDYGENEEYDEYDVIKSSILDLDYKEMFENLNNLKEINIDSHYFTSVDGILYTKDKKTLLKYPAVTDKHYFKVLDTVTSIGDSALKIVIYRR